MSTTGWVRPINTGHEGIGILGTYEEMAWSDSGTHENTSYSDGKKHN